MQLYLGLVPGLMPYNVPEIAEKMKEINAGIIFSYYTYRNQLDKIIENGMHDHFNFDGPIMIDSGAYSAMNSGIKIGLIEYYHFLSRLKLYPDTTIVNLDMIGDPTVSLDNWRTLDMMMREAQRKLVMPVIHYPKDTFSQFYGVCPNIGLGGAVPAFKINEKGSVYDVAEWINNLVTKKQWGGTKFHGFGIGSPYHQIVFEDVLHSVDWMGWRRNASVCCVYTPEGSRYILAARKTPPRGKALSEEEFEKYKPPFIDKYNELEIWENRALWNVWQFLTAQEYKEQMSKSVYVKAVKKRLNK